MKQETQAKQLTLLEVMHREDEIVKEYDVWDTDFFIIRAPKGAAGKWTKKVEVKKKKSDESKFTKKTQMLKKMEWVQQRMKPLLPNINGDQWEASRYSLYREIFDEEFVE